MRELKAGNRKQESTGTMNADEVEVQVEGLLLHSITSGLGMIGNVTGNDRTKHNWSDSYRHRQTEPFG